jgi:hypothetical protein
VVAALVVLPRSNLGRRRPGWILKLVLSRDDRTGEIYRELAPLAQFEAMIAP